MDYLKIGTLIKTLRRGRHLTQKALGEEILVGDKAISKWERGLGCPDVSLLPALSKALCVNLEELLSGELDANDLVGGNMKKMKFYVCPHCGNILTAAAEAAVYCCGMKLEPLNAEKAAPEEKLAVEIVEGEYYVSSAHEMTKEHYVAFVAFLTGDTLILRKLYPEWNLETRLPRIGHGQLLHFCTKHGLKYQLI